MEVLLTGENWCHRVRMARGFRQRLTGLRGSRQDMSLLITTRSVHGFGMDRPILAVGIDSGMSLIGSKLLRPNRMVVFPRARYVLEVPPGEYIPPVGTKVRIEKCDD